jgi:hypothetical protein
VGTNQVHDYAPHISSTGLFWLFEMPPAGVRADVARGTAVMRASNVAMPDARNNEGSIVGGPWVPATVSFDVEWSTPLARATRRNEAGAWGGEYAETQSRIAWSARQEGFAYQSDPIGTSTSVWGVVGRQRSGAYFRQLGLPRTGGGPRPPGPAGPRGVGGAAGTALAAGLAAGLARRRNRA